MAELVDLIVLPTWYDSFGSYFTLALCRRLVYKRHRRKSNSICMKELFTFYQATLHYKAIMAVIILLVHITLFHSWITTGGHHAPLEMCAPPYILELSPLVPLHTTQNVTASSSSTIATHAGKLFDPTASSPLIFSGLFSVSHLNDLKWYFIDLFFLANFPSEQRCGFMTFILSCSLSESLNQVKAKAVFLY